jgi:UDPglucose 6-dehydrogenase
MPLINAAIASNETAHKRVADRLMHALGGSLVDKTIAVLGVTFKANTDDIRESPSIAVIERLVGRGAKVQTYDPMATQISLSSVSSFKSAREAANNADALVVLTEWDEFTKLNAIEILNVMKDKFVVDTRNVLNKKAWEQAGANFPGLKS